VKSGAFYCSTVGGHRTGVVKSGAFHCSTVGGHRTGVVKSIVALEW